MIKGRPHRLDRIYIDQPLFFVTFSTRNRRKIPSLDRANAALKEYGRRASETFNVGVGRYVIMPDHVHLFIRGDQSFVLSPWVGGLKRAVSVALRSPRLWQPGQGKEMLQPARLPPQGKEMLQPARLPPQGKEMLQPARLPLQKQEKN